MKNIALFFLMTVLCTGLLADIFQYYTFTPGTGTYTPINGTIIPNTTGNQAMSDTVGIGFTFMYGPNAYNQVKISSNGYVALGTSHGPISVYGNNLAATYCCPVVAPLWDDTSLSSSAQVLMEGTAPNRVFTVQYSDMKWNYTSTSNYNFQVKLFETGKVEFVYGAASGAPTNASASIGINMLPGGSTNYWSVTPGNPAYASNTAQMDWISTWPGNGTVYDFNPRIPDANDLAAISITGNLTPVQGTINNYTISVHNNATAAQSAYSVKIMSGTTVLASVAGPVIQPGASLVVTVPWIPQTTGGFSIFGKVALTGDQNTANDNSPSIDVVVQSSGTTAITIGNGSESALIPIDINSFNSVFETIYPASELGMGGVITGLAFYNNFGDNRPNMPTQIWMGVTTQTDLSAGWISATQMVPVFDGTVNYPYGQNTINIPFSTPFPYGGSNIVLLVNRPEDTSYYDSQEHYFRCQTVGTNRSRTISSYVVTAPFNPDIMGTVGTVSGQFPKTTFYMNPAGTNPVFGVEPELKNYGQVVMNHTNSQAFTIFNMGGGSLTINSIELTGSPMFNLQNLPAFPLTMNYGQPYTFNAVFAPTLAGQYTAAITVTDNQTRLPHTIALSGSCLDPTIYTSPYAQNFDEAVSPFLPLDWSLLVTGIGRVITVTNSPYSSPNCVFMYKASDAVGPFLISPPISPALQVSTMRATFWAKAVTGHNLSVGVMSDPAVATTYTPIQTINVVSAWTQYVVTFQAYTGEGHYIAFTNADAVAQRLYVDDVLLEVVTTTDLSALTVTGNTVPIVGTSSNYLVTIANGGTLSQSNYQVKLFQQGDVEVASVPGTTIASGGQLTVTVPWTPATPGVTFIYGKVVITGDQNNLNDQTPNLNISIQASGTLVVTVGEGDQQVRLPVDMWYRNSLSETIYMATEFNYIGNITGIALYNNFVDDRQNMPTKIWMGTTTLTDLSGGWIPSTQMTQVFDGEVDYPIGQNTVTIILPTPYVYLQDNLVVMFNRPMDSNGHNMNDKFYCQELGEIRTRNIGSDDTVFNPAAPPAGATAINMFPKTTFFLIPGGVGHLTGIVYGAGNQPLTGATVQVINGAQATTNETGHYSLQNITIGEHQITVTKHGYVTQTLNVTILESQILTLNINMVPMATVVLSGMIVGSDAPTIGLSGAVISFTGYENYSATTDAAGHFTIPGVFVSLTYDYYTAFTGYQSVNGSVDVLTANIDMGDIVLAEIAFQPSSVTAVANTNDTVVTINWLAPDPNAVNVTQGFENITFPPADWSRIVTNNGPPNANGVYPTWCRLGPVQVGTDIIVPSEGQWQAGFWWSFSHQDEWLITPTFNCPTGTHLTFDSNVYLGSPGGDHYYVKASSDNGATWTVLWDASALTGGWNHYQTPITIDLAQYTGQQVKLAWHADDPDATSDGMLYVWFIDNVVVTNAAQTIRFPVSQLTSRSADRSLLGYQVWRLLHGQEQNEGVWNSLTPASINALTLEDTLWSDVAAGTYRWAVKGVYTNNVLSLPIFSNPLVKVPVQTGTLAGLVRDGQLVPIMNATVTVGTLFATTGANGSYILQVPTGTYSVTCTADDYVEQTQNNIVINAGQTTPLNFTMALVDNQDEVAVTVTILKGNYPNPFNPQTTLSFDVKDRAPVRLMIYNTKGQLIRTLVNEVKANGHYTVVWNGKDQRGNAVASGIYNYRMHAGDYRSTRRMMLMK